MKVQMLNCFTNFLEKSVNRVINLVAALPDLPDLNYISHSVVYSGGCYWPPFYFRPYDLKFPSLKCIKKFWAKICLVGDVEVAFQSLNIYILESKEKIWNSRLY